MSFIFNVIDLKPHKAGPEDVLLKFCFQWWNGFKTGSSIRWLMLTGGHKPPLVPDVGWVNLCCEGFGLFLRYDGKREPSRGREQIVGRDFLTLVQKQLRNIWPRWSLFTCSCRRVNERITPRLILLFVSFFPSLNPETREQCFQTPNHVFPKSWVAKNHPFGKTKCQIWEKTIFPLRSLCYCILECCLVWPDIIWSYHTLLKTLRF